MNFSESFKVLFEMDKLMKTWQLLGVIMQDDNSSSNNQKI